MTSIFTFLLVVRQEEYSWSNRMYRGIIINIFNNPFYYTFFVQVYLLSNRMIPTKSLCRSFIYKDRLFPVFFIQHITFQNFNLEKISIILIDGFLL